MRGWAVGLAMMLGACGSRGPAADPSPRPEPAEPERAEPADRGEAEAPAHASLPSEVPTRAFTPSPIRLDVEGLPAPFASESARRPPQVVPIPDDATLEVPAGFRVQVFAEGVPSARWLALAPDGRVLCAQSRENVITALEDADGDGVAESRAVFADESNALDLPFGMAVEVEAVIEIHP